MHSFDWRGEAHPEGLRPPKVPGPLSSEAQQARAPREVNVTIFHNGDHSGNVKINLPTWVGNPSVHNFSSESVDYHIAELSVPFEAIKAFVLEYYRQQMISALEDATGVELEQLVTEHAGDFEHKPDGSCCGGQAT